MPEAGPGELHLQEASVSNEAEEIPDPTPAFSWLPGSRLHTGLSPVLSQANLPELFQAPGSSLKPQVLTPLGVALILRCTKEENLPLGCFTSSGVSWTSVHLAGSWEDNFELKSSISELAF